MIRFLIALPYLLLLVLSSNSQTNLLQNHTADNDAAYWKSYGDSTIEPVNGSKVFVIRSAGSSRAYFLQDVNLNDADAGKFALLIGRASSERTIRDGSMTGMPYLYGYMLDKLTPTGAHINAYLQGQQMRAAPRSDDEWVKVFGVFEVPKGTVGIRFFLQQAHRNGDPPTGSAARFDDLGLFLFDTRQEALQFAKGY